MERSRIKELVLTSTSYGVIFLFLTKVINAYPDGAPLKMCKTMLPNHGEQSMDTEMPFNIDLDRVFIRSTGKITVTVTSKDPKRYNLRGVLFVFKKPKNEEDAFGEFDPGKSTKHLKTINCFNKSSSGLTHTDSEPKTMLTFQWIAPNVSSADYELHATLVRDFNSFWANIIHPETIRVRVDAPASTQRASVCTPLFVFAAAAFLLPGIFS